MTVSVGVYYLSKQSVIPVLILFSAGMLKKLNITFQFLLLLLLLLMLTALIILYVVYTQPVISHDAIN